MKLKIFEYEFGSKKPKRYFALFPKIVSEAHPTHGRKWLIWLEWYERDEGENWLPHTPSPTSKV